MKEPLEVHPRDEWNQSLLAQVQPEGYRNPVPAGRYQLLVVGAGTAGLVAAAGAKGLGARVALIERDLLGGDCLNFGCVPSKALLRSARAASEIRRASAHGLSAGDSVHADFGQVMQRLRRIRAGLARHDSVARFVGLGVDVFLGPARFIGPQSVEVAGQTLPFRRAVLATGARAARPAIPGLEEAGYQTNETIFSLTQLPPRLVVIGGGPIGCELAQAFARLGSQVDLVTPVTALLPKEDASAAAVVQQALIADGVRLHFGARVTEVRRQDDLKRLQVQSAQDRFELLADEVLVAVGRAPNVADLNLAAAGVDFDAERGVHVNDRLQTTNPRIFAAGDCCSAQKFTHAADAQARLVIGNALFYGRGRASQLLVPRCTYTDPEVASVGLNERAAQEANVAYEQIRIDSADVDRAVLDGATEGYWQLLLRPGTDRLLGGTIVGPHAGELISLVTLAMNARQGLKRLARNIYPYPTAAAALGRAVDAYQRTRLTPRVRALLQAWFSWMR